MIQIRQIFLKDRFSAEFKPAFEACIKKANQISEFVIHPGISFDLLEYQPVNYAKSKELEEKRQRPLLKLRMQ